MNETPSNFFPIKAIIKSLETYVSEYKEHPEHGEKIVNAEYLIAHLLQALQTHGETYEIEIITIGGQTYLDTSNS